MMTFTDMEGWPQQKYDIMTRKWERGDSLMGEVHLYTCFLVTQNIPLLKSLEPDGGCEHGV